MQPSGTGHWYVITARLEKEIILLETLMEFRFDLNTLDAARQLVAGRALKRNPRFKCSSARYVQLHFFSRPERLPTINSHCAALKNQLSH